MSSAELEPIRKGNCKRLYGLSTSQVDWCKKNSVFFRPIVIGTRLGLNECKRRFARRRWSCPVDQPNIFSKVLNTATPEAAFVHGIESAGITLAIARTCSRGDALSHCACNKSQQAVGQNWTWGSCSDDFQSGDKFAGEFLSGMVKANDSTSTIAGLNHRFGRKVVGKSMQFLCKCHGFSGSCVQKTCWYSLPTIGVVAEQLLRKYDKIFRVVWNSTEMEVAPFASDPLKQSLKQSRMTEKLVYQQPSPDYCEPNKAIGSLGTHGRECEPRIAGPTSCDTVCCQRGYNERRRIASQRCRCRFHWCCRVECDWCRVVSKKYTCW
ncbi:protein wingless-like isoform X2 [Sycon ciliatum]